MSDVHGLQASTVGQWLQANVPGAVGPFVFDIIAGGHSNLTYKVTGADGATFVLRDRAASEAVLSPAARRAASESLVDTMAAIHRVDLQAAGLHDLGRHEGYIARQLKRWYGQWNQQKTRELPAVDRVHDLLSQRIPEQGPATIVHG
ncbi:MAG: phosphotransferase, partial [Actinomycetota bacterium]|nr:phosphotransferase [Actinomycetota bacterium]